MKAIFSFWWSSLPLVLVASGCTGMSATHRPPNVAAVPRYVITGWSWSPAEFNLSGKTVAVGSFSGFPEASRYLEQAIVNEPSMNFRQGSITVVPPTYPYDRELVNYGAAMAELKSRQDYAERTKPVKVLSLKNLSEILDARDLRLFLSGSAPDIQRMGRLVSADYLLVGDCKVEYPESGNYKIPRACLRVQVLDVNTGLIVKTLMSFGVPRVLGSGQVPERLSEDLAAQPAASMISKYLRDVPTAHLEPCR